MVDREYVGSISTRKLVIETAKLNVITAYSGAEAIAMLERFPAVDGVVSDTGIADLACGEVIERPKSIRKVPVVAIGTPRVGRCAEADYFLEAFEPGRLLDLLRRIAPEAQRVLEREKAGFRVDE